MPTHASTASAVPAPRRFWQLHLSTAIVLTLVTGLLIGLNCLPTVGPSERAYGWPFPVVRFLGELPATVRWDWPLWFNVFSNGLILVYARVVWEHLTRPRALYTRLLHGATPFFVALATAIVLFLNFYPRPPRAPVQGRVYGWPLVVSREVRYVFDGSEQEWLAIHSTDKDGIQREFGEGYEWTGTRDEATQQLHVVMTNSVHRASDAAVRQQANAVTGLLLILTAAIAAEWAFQRRSRAKSHEAV